jgi:membrane associated rhomboid family serine protease
MLTLFFFGTYVEDAFTVIFGKIGLFYFIFMYVSAMFISSIYTLAKHKDNYSYNAVGASGAVSAVLFSFILLNPLDKIYFFFIPIGIPAIVFGVAYLLYSAYMSKQNMDNIGHDAHFYGAVFGFLFPLALDYNLIYNFIGKLFNF